MVWGGKKEDTVWKTGGYFLGRGRREASLAGASKVLFLDLRVIIQMCSLYIFIWVYTNDLCTFLMYVSLK